MANAALEALRAERQGRLNVLGPRPPWWRPFARRRWNRRVAEITAYPLDEFSMLLREYYSNDYVEQMARDHDWANLTKVGGRS